MIVIGSLFEFLIWPDLKKKSFPKPRSVQLKDKLCALHKTMNYLFREKQISYELFSTQYWIQ